MTDAEVPDRAAGVGRLGTAAAWISAACCLPYLVLKVVWTAGLPVGITDRSVLHGHGWAAANALMAAIELAGLLLVLALTRPWARRVPAWLLLFPVWAGTGLLFRVAVGAALAGLFSLSSHASGGSTGGIQPWVFMMVYASFAGQGAALAIAFACYVRARWGPLLGERTGQVVAKRTARARSWAEHHLPEMAVAVAGLAVVVATVFCYWAAGGSFGLSGAQPHPSRALEVSGAAGAVIAVAGLLGLTGRWGHQTRFWLPAALAWVGSGSLAAFDGLELFLAFGTGLSGSEWSLTDTVLVIEVAIGVLCAALGALAVTSAARDDHTPAGTGTQATGADRPTPRHHPNLSGCRERLRYRHTRMSSDRYGRQARHGHGSPGHERAILHGDRQSITAAGQRRSYQPSPLTRVCRTPSS
jgi:hypothetical protein